VHTGFQWGNLMERDHFEDLRLDGRIKLKTNLQEVGWGPRAGLSWLRIGTGGGR
jgi:hypothetical protein